MAETPDTPALRGADIFGLAQRRIAWLERRQSVLAQNIANADTPGWQARDLRPFADVLADGTGVTPTRTWRAHSPGTRDPTLGATRPIATSARNPDGNNVAIDEQLIRVAETESAHALATTLVRKYLALFRTAMGRAQ
jgi:flagellar basal-body rod protein FlgB